MKTNLEVIIFERSADGLNFRKGSEFHTFESNAEMREYCKANGLTPKIHKYWHCDRQHSLRGSYKAEFQK